MNQLRCRILLLVGFSLLVASLPSASALPPCLVQSINYDFPSSATPGQQITVKTHLTATCVQWPPYSTAYSIRVDLTDVATGVVGSTVTYRVGYRKHTLTKFSRTPPQLPTLRAHGCSGLTRYIWGGSGQLLVHMADYAEASRRIMASCK